MHASAAQWLLSLCLGKHCASSTQNCRLTPVLACMPRAAQWLLGLCLGNHCATGELGQDRGNGRIVVSHMRQNGSHCAWVPDRVLSLPGTAAFSAFTGLAIRDNQFLISSQVAGPFVLLLPPLTLPYMLQSSNLQSSCAACLRYEVEECMHAWG
jgi:hypothetical protein